MTICNESHKDVCTLSVNQIQTVYSNQINQHKQEDIYSKIFTAVKALEEKNQKPPKHAIYGNGLINYGKILFEHFKC